MRLRKITFLYVYFLSNAMKEKVHGTVELSRRKRGAGFASFYCKGCDTHQRSALVDCSTSNISFN
jgi:hypothetical protein